MDNTIKEIINQYFKSNNIICHQLDSYDDLIHNIIPNIIDQHFPLKLSFNNSVIKEITIKYRNLKYTDTNCIENNGIVNVMTPTIARLRNYSYLLVIELDLIISISSYEDDIIVNHEEQILEDIIFGKLPIMVNSEQCTTNKYKKKDNECIYDYGGYFIINGNEKVLISQEKIASNIIQVFENNKVNSKYKYISEIRSQN